MNPIRMALPIILACHSLNPPIDCIPWQQRIANINVIFGNERSAREQKKKEQKAREQAEKDKKIAAGRAKKEKKIAAERVETEKKAATDRAAKEKQIAEDKAKRENAAVAAAKKAAAEKADKLRDAESTLKSLETKKRNGMLYKSGSAADTKKIDSEIAAATKKVADLKK